MATNIESRVQTQAIVLPVGTTAGKRNFSFDLDSDFKRVRGFYLVRNVGADYLKVGVKDAAGSTILEPTNSKHLEVSTNPAIKDRFFCETPFEANGKKVIVSVENFATISGADLTMDMLYLLDNGPKAKGLKGEETEE